MGLLKKKKTRAAYWLVNEGEEMIPGYTSLSENEEIIRCANIIADLVSSMTIMLMANGENGDFRIKNELSKRMDIYPSKIMDRKNFIFKIVRDMIMTGNSVAIPEIEGTSIKNIRLLPASDCSFLQEGDGYYISYRGIRIESDEALHFCLVPDRNYPFRGEGYKKAIKEAVLNLIQANTTKKGFLRSKWKPSLIISIQADAEELQDKELRRKILGSYTDTTEEGEPWLIPAGEIDVKTVQPLTLNDLAIQDSITLDRRTIATAIGIPPFLVGIGEFNKEAYNNFISTKIMSIAMIIQQQLTNKLLISPDMYWKMNPKSLMQYALSEHVAFVKEMVAGGMLNRNEGRNEFDYSPVNVPGMNDYIVLENYIPVEKVGDQKKLKDKGE